MNDTQEELKEAALTLINEAIESLYNYDLYGTKEIIDLVRSELPYNIKPVEIPEGFLPDKDKVYLIPRKYEDFYR